MSHKDGISVVFVGRVERTRELSWSHAGAGDVGYVSRERIKRSTAPLQAFGRVLKMINETVQIRCQRV